MFPLRDDIPSLRFPFVNLTLIVLNVWIFGSMLMGDPEATVNRYALVPSRDFAASLAPLPFVTSVFLHGGFGHLILNMWSLWIFGDNVEGRMGSVRYLVFYLVCGALACLAHSMLNPGSALPVVGASGAISGVMGAYLFLFPKSRLTMLALLIFYPIFFQLPAVVFLILWFLGQLLSASGEAARVAATGGDAGGIAFAAHIGGFVAGILLLPVFKGRHPGKRARRAQV